MLSSATVTLVEVVALSALPVRSPVILLVVAGNLSSLMVPELMLEAFNDVNDAPEPLKVVAVKVPLEESNVKLVPLLGGKSPVAAVTNKTLQVVSVLSSATVTLVEVLALSALPVRSPVILLVIVAGNLSSLMVPELMLEAFNDVNDAPPPLNSVAVKVPLEELKVKLDPLGVKDHLLLLL